MKNSISQMIKQISVESVTNRMGHMGDEILGFEDKVELDLLVKVSDKKKFDWKEHMRSIRHSKDSIYKVCA